MGEVLWLVVSTNLSVCKHLLSATHGLVKHVMAWMSGWVCSTWIISGVSELCIVAYFLAHLLERPLCFGMSSSTKLLGLPFTSKTRLHSGLANDLYLCVCVLCVRVCYVYLSMVTWLHGPTYTSWRPTWSMYVFLSTYPSLHAQCKAYNPACL